MSYLCFSWTYRGTWEQSTVYADDTLLVERSTHAVHFLSSKSESIICLCLSRLEGVQIRKQIEHRPLTAAGRSAERSVDSPPHTCLSRRELHISGELETWIACSWPDRHSCLSKSCREVLLHVRWHNRTWIQHSLSLPFTLTKNTGRKKTWCVWIFFQ